MPFSHLSTQTASSALERGQSFRALTGLWQR